MEQQKDWLLRLNRVCPLGFQMYLTGERDGSPTKWIPIQHWDWDRPVYYRSILPNEILFDVESKTTKAHMIEVMQSLMGRLRHDFYPFDSGGSGYHLSVFLKQNDPSINIDWDTARLMFARWILRGLDYGKPTKVRKFDIDFSRIQWSSQWKGVIVRACGAYKGIGVKTLIDKNDFTKPHIIAKYPDFVRHHFIDLKDIKQQSKTIGNIRLSGNFKGQTAKLCLDTLIQLERNGYHLPHLARVAVVNGMYNRLRPSEITLPLLIEELVDIFSFDPCFDEAKTRGQIQGIVSAVSYDPSKIMGNKKISQLCSDELGDKICKYCMKCPNWRNY